VSWQDDGEHRGVCSAEQPGLDRADYGTHTLRRAKATLIYMKCIPRAVKRWPATASHRQALRLCFRLHAQRT
jgi:hypothetical protein